MEGMSEWGLLAIDYIRTLGTDRGCGSNTQVIVTPRG